MPISLVNLTQVLMWKVKMVAGRHRKKLIFGLVLLIVGYIAKKKLTFNHVLSFVEGVTKLVQALPLPQAPKMRRLAEYEHPSTVPLKGILEATQLEEMKKKIAKKEAGWQDLKKQIATSVVLTLTLYNTNSIYFLLQNKYRQQFMDLNASTQFEQAMYIIRKRFTDEIPLLFQTVKNMLSWEFQRLELTRIYDVEELSQKFQRMVQRVFEMKYDIRNEGGYSSMGKVGASARNYFLSTYQYVPEKKTSIFGKVGGSILKLMGGVFSVGELFPQAKVQISTQRYLFTKMAYLQPLKKATNELQDLTGNFNWPNKQSKQLFSLLIQQIQFILTSLNFSTLLKAFTRYNLKILRNRFYLLLIQRKKIEGIKVTELLPSLYKILQEEFLKMNMGEFRDRYHSSELKRALKVVAQHEGQNGEFQEQEEKGAEEHILEQIQLKQSFHFLEKQLQLKIYNERSGFVMHPKASSGDRQAEEMKRLLGMMSSSEMFSGGQE